MNLGVRFRSVAQKFRFSPLGHGEPRSYVNQYSWSRKALVITLYGDIIWSGGKTPIARDTGNGISLSFFYLFYDKWFPDKRATHLLISPSVTSPVSNAIPSYVAEWMNRFLTSTSPKFIDVNRIDMACLPLNGCRNPRPLLFSPCQDDGTGER